MKRGGSKTRIRVVDVLARLGDVLSMDQETLVYEVEAIERTLKEAELDANTYIQSILLAQRVDAATAPADFLKPAPEPARDVALRALLAEPFVFPTRPRIPKEFTEGNRSGRAAETEPGSVRAPRQVHLADGSESIAPEERLDLVTAVADRRAFELAVAGVFDVRPVRPTALRRGSGNYLYPTLVAHFISTGKIQAAPAAFWEEIRFPEAIATTLSTIKSLKALALSGYGTFLASAIARSISLGEFRRNSGGIQKKIGPAAPEGPTKWFESSRNFPALVRTVSAMFGPEAMSRAVFLSTPLASLHSHNLVAVYDAAVAWPEDPAIEAMVARERIRGENARTVRDAFVSRTRMRNEAGHLALIAKARFGDKYATGAASDPKKFLETLQPRDRSIVVSTYANWKKAWDSQVANPCPHVPLVIRLRRNGTVRDMKFVMARLAQYLPPRRPPGKQSGRPASDDDFLICRNCHHAVVCPHVVEWVALEIGSAPFSRIEQTLQKYAVPHQSGSDTTSSYCRICGELLSVHVREKKIPEVTGLVGLADLNLSTFVWRVAIEASRYMRFSSLTDPKRFASIAASVCYPLVVKSQEAELKRGAKMAADALPPAVQLYAVVFVYAYVLNLIVSTAGTTSSVGLVGVDSHGKSFKASVYAQRMVEYIAKDYSLVVSQLTKHKDFVINRFKEAYRSVLDAIGKQKIVRADPVRELIATVSSLDPMFAYARKVYSLAEHKQLQTSQGEQLLGQIDVDVSTFETITGYSLTKARKRGVASRERPDAGPANLYADIYIPSQDTESIRFSSGIIGNHRKPMPSSNPDDPRLDPAAVADIVRSWVGGRADSRKSVDREYYLDSYRLFARYVSGRTDPKEYGELLDVFRKDETKMLLEKRKGYVPPFHNFDFTDCRVRSVPRAAISELYDEDGNRHEWGLFVFKAAGRPVELRAAEIQAFRDKNPGAMLAPVDIRCSICHVSVHATAALDEIKVWKAYAARRNISTLFVFFETRCPKEGLHNMEKKKCTKCGITEGMFEEVKAGEFKESRAYYDKYSPVYEKERKVLSEFPIESAAPKVKAKPTTPKAEWEYDFGIVRKVADLASVDVAVIESIGNSENRTEKEILAGKNLLPEPSSREDHRIRMADAAVRYFLVQYLRFKNAPKLSVQTAKRVDEFLRAHNLSHTYKELSKILPDLLAEFDYNDRLRGFIRDRTLDGKYSLVRMYIVDQLCRMAHRLATAKQSGPLGKALARQIMQNVARSSMMFSKPDYNKFSFTIFSDKKTFKNPDGTSGDYGAPDSGLAGEDALSEPSTAGEIYGIGSADPFSYEGMDYDGHNEEPA